MPRNLGRQQGGNQRKMVDNESNIGKTKVTVTLADGSSLKGFTSVQIDGWDSEHGETAKGNKVQSLRSKMLGNKAFVQNPSNGTELIGSIDEVEVFAKNHLTRLGYTVTPPTASQTKA